MEVKIDKLVKIFDSKKRGGRVVAVNNMTFDIPDGKLCGLLGPSGCGKSTTLYMIAGLHKPSEGRIFFGNEDVTNVPAENRGIGLVFQNYALYPHLNVRQNIMFPLDNVRPKLTYDEKCAIALENAKIVNIEKLLDRKPKELSGGQQQRVAIARALAKRPRVLLLDEPLSNLDARLRLQTREEIKRIQKQTGITTIFVTHDQEEAMSISDFIVVMKDGIVQQKDEPQKVYEEPANLFVAKFLGTPAINTFDGEIKGDTLYIAGNVLEKSENLKKVHIEELVCPHCGAIVSHNAKYCNVCGRNLLIGTGAGKSKNTPYFLNKKVTLPEGLSEDQLKLAKELVNFLDKFDNQNVIAIYDKWANKLNSEADLASAKDEIALTRAKEVILKINPFVKGNKDIIEKALLAIEKTSNPSTKEGRIALENIVKEANDQVLSNKEHNLVETVVLPSTEDKKVAKLFNKVVKYLNKFDDEKVIELVNKTLPTITKEEEMLSLLDAIEVLRAEEEINLIEAETDYAKRIIKESKEMLKDVTRASSKAGLADVKAIVKRTLNGVRLKEYADKINSLFSDSDWEATSKIKKAQLDMIFGIDDISRPESQETINKIITSLEHRLNPMRKCKIGIRAESFDLDENGPIEVKVENIEHIGRDISVVGEINGTKEPIKIIVSSELAKKCAGKEILRFKAKRIYVFEETGERIL